MTTKKLTKKEFKELVSYHCYTGNRIKFHCFYYDWKEGIYGENKSGYKFAFCENAKSITKKQLFDIVYDHLFNGIDCSNFTYNRSNFTIWLREAKNDNERFKVSLSLNLNLFN